MKKLFILPMIGLILGAVAIATEIRTTDLLPHGQGLSGVVVSCIQNALEQRETTIVSAVTTYQTSNLLALESRKSSLLAAWDKATKSEIKSAISTTWKSYKDTLSALKSTLHTSRKNAWDSYKTDIKACNATAIVKGIDTSSSRKEE